MLSEIVENGRLIEEGTHASLVAEAGLYARLGKRQFEPGAAALDPGETAAAE